MRAIQSTQSRPSTHSIDTTESKKTGRIIEKALKEAVEDGEIPDVKQVCLEDFNSYSGYLSVVVKGKQGTFDYRYYLLGDDKDFNLRTVTSPVNETYAVKVIPNTIHGGMTTTAPPFYIEITEDAAEQIMSNKDMALKRMRDIELRAV